MNLLEVFGAVECRHRPNSVGTYGGGDSAVRIACAESLHAVWMKRPWPHRSLEVLDLSRYRRRTEQAVVERNMVGDCRCFIEI